MEKRIEIEEDEVEKQEQEHKIEMGSVPSASSSDSFINDDDSDEDDENQESAPEEPLTDKEIDELIADLLEVESKAAEAQEALEEESVAKVEADVREELSQALTGDELENAVADEMATFKEEWETVLDELETESAHLLEQLDGAGVELPSLYKWIESEAPHGCCTAAWKNRTQWVGSQLTNDITEAIADAEKYLQNHRPVRRRHGKILEEGASGFLAKKLAGNDCSEAQGGSYGVDWGSFSKLCSDKSSTSMDPITFGSSNWASVYLASTPQQAAELGLRFPGVDEVEEIDDVEDSSVDPFVADAIANERELNLSEEQRKKFRKVKEEDDLRIDQKLQRRLKQRRYWDNKKLEEMHKVADEDRNESQDFGFHTNKSSTVDDEDAPKSNEDTSIIEANLSKCLHDIDSQGKGSKRLHDFEEMEAQCKKARIITLDIEEEDSPLSPICSRSETGDQCNPQRVEDDVLPVNSLPASKDNQKFRCTACDEVAIEVRSHPLLKVIVCLDCKNLVKAKMEDIDCSECYCRWCGRCSDLLSCRSCKKLFCSVCIRRNLGEKLLLGVKSSGWQCCCCSPSVLHPLTSVLEKAMESQGLVDCSTDTDSDNSDADVNGHRSTKRRRKKKIRRILDDTELGEETKRKIAIEKERQERLKSLEAQFSSKSEFSNPWGCSKSSYEGGSLEILGDVETGYIVNVVREEGEEPVRIPPSISAKLKTHQVSGIRFMWQNIIQSIRKVQSGDKGLGCILAHTMGLGKTFQVIAFLYAAMRSVDLGLRTALIVTPVSVLHNWRQEFIKWRPSELKPLRVFMLEDVPREKRAELLRKWRLKGGVFLIGYTAFRNLSFGKHIKDRHVARDICQTLQDGPDILVCDEAHIIKNTKADVTQVLKQVKCQRRIALTGSPLQNNLMEFYCMVDFVREGFLGSSHEFRNRFQNPIENGQHTNSTADDVKIMNQRSHILYEQLKGFVQRMDMNVVKKDLPPKTVFVMSVKLSPLQRKLYKRFLDVHRFTKDKVSGEKRSFFAGYQALAQIWNHPWILQLARDNKGYSRREDAIENFLADDCSSDENTEYNMAPGEKLNNNNEALRKDGGFLHGDWWRDLLENNCKEVGYSGKMVLLLDILTMSSNAGDKALVFSQSLLTLDLIELYLSKLPRPGKKGEYWKRRKDWYRLDGSTESSERQKIVENFNDVLNRRVKCALISTRAGSLGINLYAANRVIIVDGSWNPTHDLQAIYRAWRYGQTKPVFAYRLLAHGTMEEKIYKRQVTKEGLAARVVDRQQVHRTMSKEEMLHLFEFGDDESSDILPELKHSKEYDGEAKRTVDVGSILKQKLPLPNGNSSSDKLMQSLIDKHHPRWIANFHEHETLLQENEDEKLSKEEQEMAWEVYRRSLEWEEHRVLPEEPAAERQHAPTTESLPKQKPVVVSSVSRLPPEDSNLVFSVGSLRCRLVPRKCTNLSHLLTLRSQGTKMGCNTVCGECAQEISWEDLNGDGKSAKLGGP